MDCDDKVVSTTVVRDVLKLLAYLYGLYLFRFLEPEYLSTLMETVRGGSHVCILPSLPFTLHLHPPPSPFTFTLHLHPSPSPSPSTFTLHLHPPPSPSTSTLHTPPSPSTFTRDPHSHTHYLSFESVQE